ncbi:hypothetical protein POSPLADRAFT_1046822 [Postia placenta MAD-698-R-SB12]|uniref:DUF6533 domain-containing protein n=1 Tax=Postia placenta MAD-698-R-SB12 TaxID=670580 RepID=A0A1X6MYI4_9APHY|nr:hypothetical protein POSPLADRAFT_1046822 [Postia placenta MAD-698-R-SB12]OSX61424.1 hypothetical protein POSPLADRAFT_1046822 [Postia placenta MAD-698-R-SB12]
MSDDDAAAVNGELSSAAVMDYYWIAVSVVNVEVPNQGLLLFDCLISLGQEVHVVWGRKLTGASILYLLLRYSAVLNAIVVIVALSNSACQAALCLVMTIAQTTLSAFHVYAIQGGRWEVALLVMTIGLVPVATNIWGLYEQKPTIVFGFCTTYWSAAIHIDTSNALVLLATWKATYGIKRLAERAKVKVSISTLLFRDERLDAGTIQFTILLALNSLVMTLFLINNNHDITGSIDMFMSLLLCRFFLNLRQVHLSESSVVSMNRSSRSTPSFVSRVVGNLARIEWARNESWDSTHETYLRLHVDQEVDQSDEMRLADESEHDGIEEVPRVARLPLQEGLGLPEQAIDYVELGI